MEINILFMMTNKNYTSAYGNNHDLGMWWWSLERVQVACSMPFRKINRIVPFRLVCQFLNYQDTSFTTCHKISVYNGLFIYCETHVFKSHTR